MSEMQFETATGLVNKRMLINWTSSAL
jgi:hypothetical protein